jgi:hypothetical protein
VSKKGGGGGKKVKTSYWDRVNWDMPLPSFVPDKWYYRVAWAALLLGLTVYANFKYGAGGGGL